MLVCASFFFPRKFAPSADGISPLGDGNTDSSLRLRYGSPTRNPNFAAGIFPFRVSSSKIHLLVKPPLKGNHVPTPLLKFSHSEAEKFAGITDGTIPFGNNTANLPNHSQDRPTMPVIKISIPKRRDHSDSKSQQ